MGNCTHSCYNLLHCYFHCASSRVTPTPNFNAGERNMLQILVFVSFGITVFGFVKLWSNNLTKRRAVLGIVMLLGGIITMTSAGVIDSLSSENARIDRASRTTVVTDVVIQAYRMLEERGCIQYFTLDRTSYTFEERCSSFIETDSYQQSLKVGDVLRLKFVRPKESAGKPEVLEVYNLTQELERLRSAPSPTLEAPVK